MVLWFLRFVPAATLYQLYLDGSLILEVGTIRTWRVPWFLRFVPAAILYQLYLDGSLILEVGTSCYSLPSVPGWFPGS